MKLLGCLLLALNAAEGTSLNSTKSLHQKVQHEALTSWGHHASVVSASAALQPQAHTALRKLAPALLSVEEGQHKQTHYVRICNAFAYTTAIDVYRGEPPGAVEKLTRDTGPLPYKRCFDMASLHLRQGDRLQFKVGDVHLGTFAVTDVPAKPQDMTMLLVFFRNDRLTTSMRFASHAFQDKYSPQIAIIDAYAGPSHAWIKMRERKHEEQVSYGNVITVQAGTYDVELQNSNGGVENLAVMHLDARAHETYVVMRTGVKAYEGPTYPEELVAFPGGWSSAVVQKLSAVVLLATVSSLCV